MPFTISTFFQRVDLPEEELRKHRFEAGIRIKNSWWNRNFTNVEKVFEPPFMVCQYPDDFLLIASKIAASYIKEKNLPVVKRSRKDRKVKY